MKDKKQDKKSEVVYKTAEPENNNRKNHNEREYWGATLFTKCEISEQGLKD